MADRSILTAEELEALRGEAGDELQERLYRELAERCRRNTRQNKWVQDGDTQLWYHLCWERMSDAAFVWAVEKDPAVGQWIRARVREVLRLSKGEWCGPDFRENFRSRTALEPIGALETGHVTLAMCEAYLNAGDVLNVEEKELLLSRLREYAIPLCRGFLEVTLTTERAAHYGNWTTVMSNALGMASMVTEDRENLRFALDFMRLFTEQFSENDYGETVQYSNYAALHMVNLYECARRLGWTEEEDFSHIERLMPWYAESLLYVKPVDSVGMAPRSVNFGDSAAIFRPSGNVLAFVSRYSADETARGLASWLLEKTYREDIRLPDELATFGFVNQFGYLAVVNVPYRAAEISPEAAGLPLTARFARGVIISRDAWQDTRATVAIMAGYDPKAPVYTKAGHSHDDQNSFTVTVGRERILADPGHCNYRSRTDAFSMSEMCHSVPQIYGANGRIGQQTAHGSAAMIRRLGNQLVCFRRYGDVQVIASDAANQYAYLPHGSNPHCNVLRVWLMRLPHMMAVVDYIRFEDTPVSVGGRFVINQRDNKTKITRLAQGMELDVERGGEGLKLFCGGCEADGKKMPVTLKNELGYMHDFYHPLENRAGQGREGSAALYEWKTTGMAVRNVMTYALAMDRADSLDDWTVEKCDGETIVRSNVGDQYLAVRFDMGRITLITEKETHEFNPYFSEQYERLSERRYYLHPIL